MKVREPVTIAMGVFALFYFAEWVINKVDPEPEQCWFTEVVNDKGTTSSEWKDCDTETLNSNK